MRQPRTEQYTNKRDFLEVCEAAQNRTAHKQEGLFRSLWGSLEQCTNKRDFSDGLRGSPEQNNAQTRGTFYKVCEAAQNRTVHKQEGLFIRFVRQNTKQRDFSSGLWGRIKQNRGTFHQVGGAPQHGAEHRQEGFFLTVFGQSRTEHKQDVFFRRHRRT